MASSTAKQPDLLKLVGEEHPILHKRTIDVKFPLSDEDKHLIASMRYSIQSDQLIAAGAPWDRAAGMAANQWGHSQRIFAYFADTSSTQPEIIINPSYDIAESAQRDTTQANYEGCFSVPKAFGSVERVCHIRVKYQDENGKHHAQELRGATAKVWCHENDHLDGFLYTTTQRGKCTNLRRFDTKQEAEEEYKKAAGR